MEIRTDPGEITFFAETNFRNLRTKFGIKRDDRRRHTYLIGKTGMGKTTVLENMIISDIRAGNGVTVVDPHGDLIEKVIDFIPSYRINDVIVFNPADTEYPIGFNVLENVNPNERHLVASGLMGVFTKIWAGVWSARMEYILNNCILALLEYPGSTMLGIARILVDKAFRKKVVEKISDPIVKGFWLHEFSSYNEKFRNEAIAPIQNKVGQFLSGAIIRNIVGQPKSAVNLREAMDNQKILLINLSKGRIGEDNSALLGAMLVTKLQLAAMSRVNIPESERKDFYLYVDEFQNFATESFASILSEARKYRLNLIIAHQYIEQLEEEVQAAVFGNVGTITCFRIGAADAEFLAKEFFPIFAEEDLLNLAKYEVAMKLMIDGVASEPFSATTLPPLEGKTNNREKVIRASQERYGTPRTIVEERILRWSGVTEMYAGAADEENTAYRPSESAYTPEGKTRRRSQDVKKINKPEIPFSPPKNTEPVIIESQEQSISLKDALAREPLPFKKARPNLQRVEQRTLENKPRGPVQKPQTPTPANHFQPLRPGQIAKL